MVHSGRFIFLGPLGDGRKQQFSKSREEVAQPSPLDKKDIEDLSPDALPPLTDSRETHIKGAKQYSQLGVAANAALRSIILTWSGHFLEDSQVSFFADLFVRVGESLQAFIEKRSMYKNNYTLLDS